jgi:hypothetical protein
MSGSPGSPRLIRGALVSIDISSPTPQIIPFQYNPDSMTRSLQRQGGGAAGSGESGHIETFRTKGPPIETINLDIELDATDKLEKPDANTMTVNSGIYPELSALEVLLYPKSQHILSTIKAAAAGVLEVIPTESPLTLFVWGPKRVVPIHLIKFEIIEEAFDTNLNPIRAKVSLGLRILSYMDLGPNHPGSSIYFANQVAKENIAKTGITNDLSAIGMEGKSFF